MTNGSGALHRWIESGAGAFSQRLDEMIEASGTHRPARLTAAMRHGVLSGGKRLRPYLVLQSARLFGLEGEAPLRAAAALEFVHCYSLIHDDLPAMDNDDLRRGQPTVHRAFDEATAILAGDALLTLAFSVLSQHGSGLGAAARLRLIGALSEAAGADGMVGGQMLDLAAEGRFERLVRRGDEAEATQIERLQGLKTGALITFGAMAGALMRPSPARRDRDALSRFGRALGLAFQIRDDLIDAEGDAGTAGKATGKDQASGKATFVSLLGPDGAKARLADVTGDGQAALAVFGEKAAPLAEVLAFNMLRRS